MLKLHEISKSFGGVHALEDVSFELKRGEILGLIGPNGAGKTTLFNVISGIIPADRGRVELEGKDISRFAPHLIARMGIFRTFQNLAIFDEMSVLENLMVGSHLMGNAGILAALLKTPAERKEEAAIRARALALLKDIGLNDFANQPARSLPFGRLRILELGRAVGANPVILLLDEPAAGLNQRESEELTDFLAKLRQKQITMIIIEHDMSLVMELSDRVVVLDQGRKIAEGAPREVQQNKAVLTAYLGEEDWVKTLRKPHA